MSVDRSVLEHDGLGLAGLVRSGEVQPVELVDTVIEAIERLDGQLNAITTPMFEIARERAAEPTLQGPFAGVPYLLKDIRASYAGVPTSDGSALLREFVRPYDSEIVARHKRAGLICVGKTNTPEFGLTGTTEPHAFGPSCNPWDVGRTTGGSSGGAGAAVAARIVPVAHASDGGGSIRIPASCCGLVGLKPTRARNPLGPEIGDVMNGLVVEHMLTVSVRDSAALLDATRGPDVGDPYCAPEPDRPFLDEVGAPVQALRVAVSTDSPLGSDVDDECVEAARSVAKTLESLGHHVEEARPEYDDDLFRKAFTTVWFSNLAATIQTLEAEFGEAAVSQHCEALSLVTAGRGREFSASDYVRAVVGMQVFARRIAQFHQTYDVFVTPTLARGPAPLGVLHPARGEANLRLYAKRMKEFTPFTQMANATGQPAVSLPLHWTEAGLPIGVQFMGRFGDEATLIRLASQLEESRPWRHRRPSVNALAA